MASLFTRLIPLCWLLLSMVFSFGKTKIIVSAKDDILKVFAEEERIFVIKENIDLDGKTLFLGQGSVLEFKGGGLSNGVVCGSSTQIRKTKNNIFHNCQIIGTWNLSYSYSSMFDDDLRAVDLLKNLSILSPNIRLFSNRAYSIDADGNEICISSISSADNNKPKVSFHTVNPNVDGLVLYGDNIILKNICFIDDYDRKNDAVYGNNVITIGNMISVRSHHRAVKSLHIQGCEFSGSTSSSFVASSQTLNCLVEGCSFSGYLGDHAVYCSTTIETFVVRNCQIKNVNHTSGVFKIRSSEGIRFLCLRSVNATNLNGYIVVASLVETPSCELLFDSITVANNDESSVFYGFCITDETQMMAGNSYNASIITIRNSRFDCGYMGAPVIYPGSGHSARVKDIRFIDTYSRQSNFAGGNADYLDVKHCTFVDCFGKAGIALHARNISIEDCKFLEEHRVSRDRLFLLNYYTEPSESIMLKNVMIEANVSNLFNIAKGESIKVTMRNTNVLTHINRVFFAPQGCKIDYIHKKNKIVGSEFYQVVGRKK